MIKTATYDTIRYKKNYLKQVIARADFHQLPEGLSKLPKKVRDVIKKRFPILEPNVISSREFQISRKELSTKDSEFPSWNFHDKNRTKRLTINQTAVFVTYTEFETFEVLKDDFMQALHELFNILPDAQISRLGLRYINEIELQESNPFEWGNYLQPELCGAMQVASTKEELSRALSVLEFNLDDFILRFQFGMHNPDYPARIKRKSFILDFDAYYQGLLEQGEVEVNLTKFHDRIQMLFEQSITPGLREIMNDEQN